MSWTGVRWKWIGLIVGVGFGLADFAGFMLLGRGQVVGSSSFDYLLLCFLVSVFALLGFALGRLAEERATVKQQLASLEAAQRALVQQEKLAAIGRLAAGIAHEVRNPLGVIRSSAAMVQEGLTPGDDSHRACEFIGEETERLNGLITTLLDFAKPVSPSVRTVPGRDVVDGAARLAQSTLEARRITLRTALPDDGFELSLDPDLTTQAILGLVVNAAEAIQENGTIEVTARRRGAGVTFDVADDGPGVSADAQQHLFEPFYTSKTKGTGLGLPMIQRSVDAQGGRLRFVPDAGLGSNGSGARFRIELPEAR